MPTPALLSLATCLLASLEASLVVPERELSDLSSSKVGAAEADRWLTLNLVRDEVAGLLDGIHGDWCWLIGFVLCGSCCED